MKTSLPSLLVVIALTVSGCATPIKNLAWPPVGTIEGTVTKLEEGGFTLTDDSDSIFVNAGLPDSKKLGLSLNEKVKVYGNLQGGQERVFDGYVIKKSSGRQIIVAHPTPRFGYPIQGSFQ